MVIRAVKRPQNRWFLLKPRRWCHLHDIGCMIRRPLGSVKGGLAELDYDKGQLTLHFTLPLKQPLAASCDNKE
jgi:hypothetical protein